MAKQTSLKDLKGYLKEEFEILEVSGEDMTDAYDQGEDEGDIEKELEEPSVEGGAIKEDNGVPEGYVSFISPRTKSQETVGIFRIEGNDNEVEDEKGIKWQLKYPDSFTHPTAFPGAYIVKNKDGIVGAMVLVNPND